MHTQNLDKIFSTWAGLASHFIGECYDLAKPYLDENYEGIDPYVRFVNSQLFIDCHLSSESSLLLIKAGKEWDADNINRSVMEGTLKYILLTTGEENEVKNKVIEYWELLPDYAHIKHHKRVQEFLQAIDDPDAPEWLPFQKLLLSEEDIKQMRGDSNSRTRKQLEQKWSFSGITKSFLESDSEHLKLLVHLAHGYGMSSHLIHKDGLGVGIVWERYRRSEEKQIVVKLGHSARVVSDICVFAELRLYHLLMLCGQDTSPIVEIRNGYKLLFDELKKAHTHFTKMEYGE